MKLIFPSIIFFTSSFCFFTLNHVEGNKFPDEGRLRVGECLGKGLGWKNDEIEELHDHLFKFCANTKTNRTYIQDDIKKKELDAEKVYTTIEECLKENPDEDLIQRYKDFLPKDWKTKANDPKFPEINQVAVGLCEEKELISFPELDDEDKPNAIKCLQKCAQGLFRKFDIIFDCIEKNYEKLRANGQIEVREIDIQDLEDEDEKSPSSTESKALVQSKPMPEKFELGVNVQQYIDDCNNFNYKEMSSLNTMGDEYLEHYIYGIDQLYKISSAGIEQRKNQVYSSVESYLACVRWPCAIDEKTDVPMKEFLIQILSKKSQEKDQLFVD